MGGGSSSRSSDEIEEQSAAASGAARETVGILPIIAPQSPPHPPPEYAISDEYRLARTRPLRNLPLYVRGEGASADIHLAGRDVGELFLRWQPAAPRRDGPPRGPAETVCYNLMEEEKCFREMWKSADEESVATFSITPAFQHRRPTSNWRPDSAASGADRQCQEVEAIFKDHEGEARVWQTSEECWVPLRNDTTLYREHGAELPRDSRG